jgi:hypothetical protein
MGRKMFREIVAYGCNYIAFFGRLAESGLLRNGANVVGSKAPIGSNPIPTATLVNEKKNFH